jgi:MSHA biogenesis protein MshG
MSEGSVPSERQVRLGRLWKKYLRLSRGGVSTLRAFAVLNVEEADEELKEVTASLGKALEEGQNLSEAMQGHPSVFSPSALALIRAAEQHGEWDAVLTELADGLLEGTFE